MKDKNNKRTFIDFIFLFLKLFLIVVWPFTLNQESPLSINFYPTGIKNKENL